MMTTDDSDSYTDETIFQPELPGDNLQITFRRDEITFYGDNIRQSITADPDSVVYCEDNC